MTTTQFDMREARGPTRSKDAALFHLSMVFIALLMILMPIGFSSAGTFDPRHTKENLVRWLGIDADSVWSMTGVLSTITVAIVVVVASAGERLAGQYAVWKKGSGRDHEVYVEHSRAYSLLALQFSLFLFLAVAMGFAIGANVWPAATLLGFLVALVQIETRQFLQNTWKDPGINDERQAKELRRELARLRRIPNDSTVVAIIWFCCLMLSFLIGVEALMNNPTLRDQIAVLCILIATGMLSEIARKLSQGAARGTGNFKVMLVGFAYLTAAIPMLSLTLVGAVLAYQAEFSIDGLFMLVSSILFSATGLLRLLGSRGRGPFRAFARSSIPVVERTLQDLQDRAAGET